MAKEHGIYKQTVGELLVDRERAAGIKPRPCTAVVRMIDTELERRGVGASRAA